MLRSLNNQTDGGYPTGVLVQASDGKLYGTTSEGGSNGAGTIFSLTPGGSYTVLRSLNSATDGARPYAMLVQASDGKLYGTTLEGGSNGAGTIFSLTPGGSYTVLRSLSSATDGANPYSGMVQASDGKIYGTTSYGGVNGGGTIFSLTPDGTFTVLRSLSSATDGANSSDLVQASDGKLYGTMYEGGGGNVGTIFSITPGGSYTVLRSLNSATDGARPQARLVQASDGKLYGTTQSGGNTGSGTIFSITTGGTYTVLRSLSYATDGGSPQAVLVQASDGKLYGTTQSGGSNGVGTIFSITTGGTYTVLRSLSSATDGANPKAGLVQANDGKLYGTTSEGGSNGVGTIFSITTGGIYTVVRSLSSTIDGANPKAGLVQASDGKLYGTTYQGGSNNAGTIFSLTSDGTYTVLRSLNSATDGANPVAGLVQASDGKLYGTMLTGGSKGIGTIFSWANLAPVAAFTAIPNPATTNASIAFDGTSSSDPEGDTLSTYTWTFGDGSAPVSGASPTTSRTYTIAGSYTATLTVTDAYGATSTPTTVNLVVNPASQTITFGSLDNKTYPAAAFTVSATASSGLTPTFSIVSGPATLNGNTLTLTGAGTVVVRANQAGNSTWAAATPVDQSFTVVDAFTGYLVNAGVPADKRAATDDPDADGVSNLLEYALGLAPMTPNSTGLPVSQISGGNLTLTYKRAVATGLTYTVQTTATLANPASWTSVGVTQGTPDVNGNVTASTPHSTGARFLRLQVNVTP